MYYTIKQFAEMFDTTEHTIRYYTDIGLIPCERDGGNRRVFDEESVNWMQGVTCLIYKKQKLRRCLGFGGGGCGIRSQGSTPFGRRRL